MQLIDKIPPMLTDDELIKSLEKYPTYENCKYYSKSKRLILVQSIFDVYAPNRMSIELYNSIYFLLIQACKRKEEGLNFHSMNNESILVCGDAGIGKSETISRIDEIMFNHQIIELENPYVKVIPILVVQCSLINSFKGFLLSILFAIDSRIGTNYGSHANKTNVNTDELLNAVSKALNKHVLILVAEEMNFLTESNKTISFANSIVALSNIVNCSIIWVCVPLGLRFFMSSDYLARRALTKVYKQLDYEEGEKLIKELLKYNYTLKKPDIDGQVIRTIYNSCNGNPSLIKQVVVAAQVWAINNEYEILSLHSVKHGIKEKLTTMEPYLNNGITISHQRAIEEKTILKAEVTMDGELVGLFDKAAKSAQKQVKNVINYIKAYLDVESVEL